MTTQNITSHGNTYLYNETISDMANNSMDHVLSSVRIMKKQQPTNTVGSKIEKYNARNILQFYYEVEHYENITLQ